MTQARVLATLAPHLPQNDRREVLQRALLAAQHLKDEWKQANILATLAPHLPHDVLVAAQHLKDEMTQVNILTTLAPHLPQNDRPQLFQRALLAAQHLRIEEWHSRFLGGLALHLAALDRPVLYSIWCTILREYVSRRTRASLMEDLATLVTITNALGGNRALKSTIRALGDVATWWP